MRTFALSVGILLSLMCAGADAQLRAQTIVSGLSAPVAAIPDPLQPGVIYAVQQNGLVRTIQDTTILATPFLDVRSAISTGGERGLLGMAFRRRHPA